ncbi:MauE/DoxX family redox-associated membrane protein [Empedobacter falsenii]|uniref:MauE/DoxX family redox-associated membrane protein n=1 Tax=Empedobacter sp. GD03797 TaxID=2975382 RepID=UPI00244CF1E9|nr:MauE/DoxX family redox-associated membrane protein [Empedobacter sp. GD03797]MDH1883690.1 tellurium resistance protein TerC [Empedobacter sp. GD03797]
MRKIAPFIQTLICYLFIILFIYAAVSKLIDFENFQIQLAQSPLLSAYAGFISYAVIIVEIVIVLMLCIKRTQQIGLYASYGLMLAFTVYIYLIINYSDFVPCSCGGILEKLGWTEHLIFNLVFVGLAVIAIYLSRIVIFQKSKRKLFVTFFTISIVSVGSVIMLFLTSEHIIKQENNFTRRYLQHPIIEEKAIDLGANSYYFAGYENNMLYLGNYTAPLVLTSVNTNTDQIISKKIDLDYKDQPFKSIMMRVKNGGFYLYDGTVPIIYKGKLTNLHAETISLNDAFFNQLIVIDSINFAIRTQSSTTNTQILGKLNLNKQPKIELISTVLEKQIDGVFDTDGLLVSDSYTNELVYTYYYRNQFIVMDQDLDIKHKLNTIDTTYQAKIEVSHLSDGKNKMSAPPLLVNKKMVAHRHLLFNISKLMGKFESPKQWKQVDVIDVYRTDRRHYIGSFTVQHREENKLSDFLVTDSHFYALIGNELIVYKLKPAITDQFKTGKAENL